MLTSYPSGHLHRQAVLLGDRRLTPQGRPKAEATNDKESRRDERASPLSLGKGLGDRLI